MLSRIKELVAVNLLESYRGGTNEKIKRKLNKNNVFLLGFGLQALLFITFGVITIGMMKEAVFYEDSQAFITSTIGLIMVSMLMTIYSVYANFMNESAFESYLALPYTNKELFISKLVSVVLDSFGSYIPMAIVFIGTGIGAGNSYLYSILTGLFLVMILFLFNVMVNVVAQYYILGSTFVQKHKKVLKNIVLGLALVSLVILHISEEMKSGLFDQIFGFMGVFEAVIDPALDSFRKIYVPGLKAAGWAGVAGWGIVVGLLALVVFGKIIPRLFIKKDGLEKTNPPKSPAKAASQSKPSAKLNFIKYQLSLISDNQVIFGVLINKLYLPIILVLPSLKGGGIKVASMTSFKASHSGLYLLVGLVIGLLSVFSGSICDKIISLEGANYNYIKSLPFSLERYLRDKFRFAFTFEWLIGLVIYLPIVIVMDVPLAMTLVGLVGYTIGVYLYSLYIYRSDWANLFLNWKSAQELSDRSTKSIGKLVMTLIVMVALAVVALVVGVIMYTGELKEQWLITAGVVIVMGLVVYLVWQETEVDFWPNVIKDPSYYETSKSNKEIYADFKEHKYFPKRRLNWLDSFVLVLFSTISMQFIFQQAAKSFVDLDQLSPQELTSLLESLNSWAGVVSLVLVMGAIYFLKIPIINYKQVPRQKWKLIPGLDKSDRRFLAKYIPTAYIIRMLLSMLVSYLTGYWDTAVEVAKINASNLIPFGELVADYRFWLMVFVLIIVAPIVEEYVIRGLIMFRQPGKEPSWLALVTSSLVFALIHFPANFNAFFNYFTLGLVISYAAKKTRSVEAGIVYHMVHNILSVVMSLVENYILL